MPSTKHEVLVDMFKSRPSLAAEVLRDYFEVSVDDDAVATARIISATLTEPRPPEYHADVVVSLGEPPEALIVIEPQLKFDAKKRHSWPGYLAVLFSKHCCPVYLLVVTPLKTLARRCAQPIKLGHPGFVLTPLVLGPEAFEPLTEPAAARASPELAVLSVMAHGRGPEGKAVAEAALSALLPELIGSECAIIYQDIVLASVKKTLRQALEKQMITNYEFQSETFRRLFAKGEAKGKAEGEAKGKADGRAEGEAKGKADGRAEGKAEAVMTVLRARGLRVAAKAKRRIVACTDLDQLDQWLVRAVTVESAAKLFD